jgi:hypothetical protein
MSIDMYSRINASAAAGAGGRRLRRRRQQQQQQQQEEGGEKVTYAMQVMSEAVLYVPAWQVLIITQEVTGLVMPFPASRGAVQHSPLSQPATHLELAVTVCTAAGQLRGGARGGGQGWYNGGRQKI